MDATEKLSPPLASMLALRSSFESDTSRAVVLRSVLTVSSARNQRPTTIDRVKRTHQQLRTRLVAAATVRCVP